PLSPPPPTSPLFPYTTLFRSALATHVLVQGPEARGTLLAHRGEDASLEGVLGRVVVQEGVVDVEEGHRLHRAPYAAPPVLTFRPATLHDAAAEADVLTALFPDEPLDPGIVRSWWEMHDPDATVDRHMALRDGRVVGYVGRA